MREQTETMWLVVDGKRNARSCGGCGLPGRATVSLLFSVLLATGCSLQNFDYLQSGGPVSKPDATSGGGGGGDSAAPEDDGGAADGESMDETDGAVATEEAGLDDGSNGFDSEAMAEGGGHRTILNPSFEQGYTGWDFDPSTAKGKSAYLQYPQGAAYTPDGAQMLATWTANDPYTVRVFQVLDGLDDGKYTFKGWFNRGDGQNEVYLYARSCGGADAQTPIPVSSQPTAWAEISISGIDVIGGHCEVGFYEDANATNWLNADLFSFERDPPQ